MWGILIRADLGPIGYALLCCGSLGVMIFLNLKSTLAYSRLHKPKIFTFELSMISGALYHRVATYSVKNPVWS